MGNHICNFELVLREGLTGKITTEQRRKEAKHEVQEKSIPAGGDSTCKGPKAEACHQCLRNKKGSTSKEGPG